MRVSWMKLLMAPVVLVVFTFSIAYADAGCGGCDGAEDEINALSWAKDNLEAAKTTLTSQDKEEWDRSDIEAYLTYALATVYYAYQVEVKTSNYMHPTAGNITSLEYLAELPENPFNDWLPMVVRDNPVSFYPGDIVREICPAEAGYTDGLPVSFELYIMGPSEDWATMPIRVVTGNEQWATNPKGAFMSLGVWVEPREQMKSRWEWLRSQLLDENESEDHEDAASEESDENSE